MANKLEYILDLNNKQFIDQLKKAGVNVDKLEKGLKDTGKTGKKSFKDILGTFRDLTLSFNQGIEIILKMASAIKKVADEVIELDSNITFLQKNFKITREEATLLNSRLQALSNTFGVGINEALKASNVLAREFGITGARAIDLIAESAKKSPKDFGEVLQQIIEYSSQLSQIGIDAEQFLAISTQALQQGVFSDKGVDAIKEFNLSFREGTTATRDAFKALGLDFEELQEDVRSGSKTVFDVLIATTNRMKGLGLGSRQTGQALADIFRGAGEDAGRFIINIGTLEKGLGKVEDQIGEAQKAQLKFNETIEETKSGLFGAFFNSGIDTDIKNLINGTKEATKIVKGFNLAQTESALLSITRRKADLEGRIEYQDEIAKLNELELALLKNKDEKYSEYYKARAKEYKEIKDIIAGSVELFQEEEFIDTEMSDEEFERQIDQQAELANAYEDKTVKSIEAEKQATDEILKAKEKLWEEEDRIKERQLEKEKEFQERLNQIRTDANIAYTESFAEAIGTITALSLNSLVTQKGISDQIKSLAKQTAIQIIDIWVAQEVAKASISGFLTFGGTALAIAPIVAIGATAKGLIQSFETGGLDSNTDGKLQPGLLKGKSHKNGGIKFITKDEPGQLKEAEGNEFFIDKKTTQRIGPDKLYDLLKGRADVIRYQNGGLTSSGTMQSSRDQNVNVSLGNQKIELFVDGQKIATAINIQNNDSRNSGQILTENT